MRREVSQPAADQADAPLATMRSNMRRFYRLLGEHAPGASLYGRDDLLASIVPSAPNRSVANAVVYSRVETLADALPELSDAYDRAGVNAWTVWVPEADREAASLLSGDGHRLDGEPRAMTLDLRGGDLRPAERRGARSSDGGALAAINEAAYSWSEGDAAAVGALAAAPEVRIYIAEVAGTAAAGLLTVEEAGDCGVYFVATLPEFRGRGLASGLMSSALLDARDRGCRTSSLQATRAGSPVYARLGYRDLGSIQMWERRRPG